MFEKLKELNKLKKAQNEIKSKLEQIFVTMEKGDYSVVIRGDKKIEKLVVNGVEDKYLKDFLNDSLKETDKKVEKKMRSELSNLGLDIPGF